MYKQCHLTSDIQSETLKFRLGLKIADPRPAIKRPSTVHSYKQYSELPVMVIVLKKYVFSSGAKFLASLRRFVISDMRGHKKYLNIRCRALYSLMR